MSKTLSTVSILYLKEQTRNDVAELARLNVAQLSSVSFPLAMGPYSDSYQAGTTRLKIEIYQGILHLQARF